MAQTTKFSDERTNYYRIAYQIADDEQQDVFIIWNPRVGMTYQQGLPYIVMLSEADSWDVAHGERIQWRYS